MIKNSTHVYLTKLRDTYDQLKVGKDALLQLIDEAELTEAVYNSNAIENSTLTLNETEKILLNLEISQSFNLREVFEAKNLAVVMNYLQTKAQTQPLNTELLLLLHRMLMLNIDDKIAGRFRQPGEYVRVGNHIAPAPEQVESLLNDIIRRDAQALEIHYLEKIAKFHLDFELIHPFVDGNGRIGRLLINFQLMCLNLPPIIIRNKEKQLYYKTFVVYKETQKVSLFSDILALLLMESFHKRIAYLKGLSIQKISQVAKEKGESSSKLLNAAKRQTIPAFRERGVWMIGVEG